MYLTGIIPQYFSRKDLRLGSLNRGGSAQKPAPILLNPQLNVNSQPLRSLFGSEPVENASAIDSRMSQCKSRANMRDSTFLASVA